MRSSSSAALALLSLLVPAASAGSSAIAGSSLLTGSSALAVDPPGPAGPAGPAGIPNAASNLSGADTPASYDELVARVQQTREARTQALDEMRKKLRELSDPAHPTANDAAKRDLLVRRRSAEIAARAARRQFDLYWLERSLTPAQRQAFAELSAEDKDGLLDVRTVAQRLAVPLPPHTFKAAPVEQVFDFVTVENDVRVVGDWPALGDKELKSAMQRRSPVSLEVGRYTRPAGDTLADVVRSLTGGQGVIDATHPDAVVVTTAAGAKQMAELDRKLLRRVLDVRAWDGLNTPLDPIDLNLVPLAEAVVGGIPAGELPPVFMDWRGLKEAGLTAQTPVDLRLGVHTIGQRLAVLAEAVENRPAVKKAGGLRFDVHPVGQVIVSTAGGFGRVTAAVNSVVAAGRTDEARDVLQRRLPELKFDGLPLGDALAFIQEVSKSEVRPDWKSLLACGLTTETPVTARLANVPLAFALAVATDVPDGKPAVEWEVGADGAVSVRGPQK